MNLNQRKNIESYQLFSNVMGDKSNPLLFLIHGSPISSHGFRAYMEQLCEKYYVVAPDLLTFGKSHGPENGCDFLDLSKSLASFLKDHVSNGSEVSLALHDWGGPICLGALALLNEQGLKVGISKLLFINTGIDPKFRPHWWWPFQYRFFSRLAVVELNSFSWGLPVLMHSAFKNRETKRVYQSFLKNRSTRKTAMRLENLDMYDETMTKVSKNYKSFYPKRVHIFWGIPEPYFSNRDIEYIAEIFSHATFEKVPNAGHFPMEDDPIALMTTMRKFFLS
ncbi:MAG: alpha/beta hydrolase [Bacteriovoracaceae bacterium]|jgi:pimeloyl-ACP methyl ester carboxylesterase|nr:alpha/beta hydrolase [Bacteriovoracaceae bacterium]